MWTVIILEPPHHRRYKYKNVTAAGGFLVCYTEDGGTDIWPANRVRKAIYRAEDGK